MPVTGAVHEAAATDLRRGHRQRGMRGEAFETFVAGVRIGDVGGVEVVPHRDPLETERHDALPQGADVVGRGVLQTRVDAGDDDARPYSTAPKVVKMIELDEL